MEDIEIPTVLGRKRGVEPSQVQKFSKLLLLFSILVFELYRQFSFLLRWPPTKHTDVDRRWMRTSALPLSAQSETAMKVQA